MHPEARAGLTQAPEAVAQAARMARERRLVVQDVPRRGCSALVAWALAFHALKGPEPAVALKREPVARAVQQEMGRNAPAVIVMACREPMGPVKTKARQGPTARAGFPSIEAMVA